MSVHDSHWLRMDDERHITGCQCGFMADENDCGYGDSVVKHIANEALTEAGRAIERRRLTRRGRYLRRHRWPADVEARWSQGMWDAQIVLAKYARTT